MMISLARTFMLSDQKCRRR